MNFPWCNIVQLHSVVSWDFQENWIPSKHMDTKIKEETFHAFFFNPQMMETFKKAEATCRLKEITKNLRRFWPASEALISRVSSCWCWVLEVWHEGIQKHRRWAVWLRCPADDGGEVEESVGSWPVEQVTMFVGIFLPSNWWVLTTAGITFSLVFVSRCLWQATFFPDQWLVGERWWHGLKIPS